MVTCFSIILCKDPASSTKRRLATESNHRYTVSIQLGRNACELRSDRIKRLGIAGDKYSC